MIDQDFAAVAHGIGSGVGEGSALLQHIRYGAGARHACLRGFVTSLLAWLRHDPATNSSLYLRLLRFADWRERPGFLCWQRRVGAGMRIQIKRLCKLSGLVAAVLVFSVTRGAIAQEGAATQVPPAASDPAQRVLGILQAHCVVCVDAGLGSMLSLDDMARDPSLVIPKQPDASRAYQVLLDLPQVEPVAPAGGDSAPVAKVPTPADVEAVRDWIDGLSTVDEVCADRLSVTAQETEAQAGRWLRSLSETQAADTRFISLAHLYSACLSEKRIQELRESMRVLLAALARRSELPNVDTLGDASTLLAIRLSDVGLTAERWANLIDGAPPFVATAVPGDWLAARVLSHPRGKGGAIDSTFDAPMFAKEEARVEALARAWNGDVDLRRAAAELGVGRPELMQMPATFPADIDDLGQRLAQGIVTRAEWDAVKSALEGGSGKLQKPASEAPASRIDVGIWTDKLAYKASDLVQISVAVDRACYLTVIDVDRDGKAIVLFPNDSEPENLIAPGLAVKVPGVNAGYQLRFDRSGRETLVAQCQRSGSRMAGLALDYEKQRFTILGDWRAFLRTAAEHEEAYQRSNKPRSRRGRKGRDDDDPPRAPQPSSALDGPPAVGRAAITVTID
jgi:hypothetical protein